MVESRCRACGSAEVLDLGACAAYPPAIAMEMQSAGLDIDPGRLLRCVACGLGQRQPCLSDEALVKVYQCTPVEAMEYEFEDNCAWSRARSVLRQALGDKGEPEILDIGCHTGLFLAGLPGSWRRYGVESAEAPVRHATNINDVRVIASRFQTIDPEWDGRFDAVTLFDVVEHLADPMAAFRRCASLLRPGGLMVVSTAMLDSWTWTWARGRHWYLQTPQHLCVVSRQFLAEVSAATGLQALRSDRISHRRGGLASRLRNTLELLYWEMRERGGIYRVPQRIIHSLPGMRSVRHKESIPWAMTLKDHVVAVMVRSVDTCAIPRTFS